MKRILHIISSLEVGGAESMLVKLVTGMDRDRFENVVVSLKGVGPLSEVLADEGIETTNGIPSVFSTARHFQPDWVQGWMVHGNLLGVPAAKLSQKGAKLGWNVRHCLDDMSNERARTRALIKFSAKLSRQCDVIIHNSVKGAEDHEAIGYPKELRRVISNGFDVERFQPDEAAKREFREAHGIPQEAFVIGNVARYHPMKHQTQLIRAIAGLDFVAYAVIVGRGVDDKNLELTALADELGVRERIRLVGPQKEVERVYPAFDLFCLCSQAVEGFPNVVGEALSCGVPGVVTDVGDAGRVVGETGIVVPPRDTDALIRALGEMRKRLDPVLREACRSRVVTNFSIERIVGEYESIYSD